LINTTNIATVATQPLLEWRKWRHSYRSITATIKLRYLRTRKIKRGS